MDQPKKRVDTKKTVSSSTKFLCIVIRFMALDSAPMTYQLLKIVEADRRFRHYVKYRGHIDLVWKSELFTNAEYNNWKY